jgi:hypothetical protein
LTTFVGGSALVLMETEAVAVAAETAATVNNEKDEK